MKSYVWLSFAFMGWAYYEMSGGSDFVPARPVPQALAEAGVEPDKAVAVTRADTTTLLSVSSSHVYPEPAIVESIVERPVAKPEIAPRPVAESAVDLRAVAGSRVNMRMGPGTSFEVITTLTGGTELEVIDITADGWANVRTTERGIEGWMAERLLTDPQA